VGAHRAVPGGLDAEREPEDLDEADGAGMVEGVTLVVGGQVLVVERERRAATVGGDGAVVEADRTSPDTVRSELAT